MHYHPVLRACAAAVFMAMVTTANTETAQGQTLTFEGDTAVFTVLIRPDKVDQFEQLMRRVHEALAMSDRPERKRQAAGWRVVRVQQSVPDGVAYFHLIHPVVPGADYSVLPILYDAFPNERQALYDLYRDAVSKSVSLATGAVVTDFGQSMPSQEPPH